jgi:hypothetical protein
MVMRRFGLYAVVISGLLGLAASSVLSAAAQDLRTTKQMQEFVANASTPAEHAQLSKHFLEMSERYIADADTHVVMAAEYRRNGVNANRRFGDPGIHCDRIAQRAREAASDARELATLHERLAAGGPTSDAKAPTKGPVLSMSKVRFPDLLTPKQAQELVANARTRADLTKLGKHFAAEAARYKADADSHAAMAAGYRGSNRRGGLEAAAVHCDRLVERVRDAATAARELATYHEGLAAEAAK